MTNHKHPSLVHLAQVMWGLWDFFTLVPETKTFKRIKMATPQPGHFDWRGSKYLSGRAAAGK